MIAQDGRPDGVLRVRLGGVTPGHAVRVTIDDGEPMAGVGRCMSTAICMVDFAVPESFVARMKTGQSVMIAVTDADGRQSKRIVRLAGLAESLRRAATGAVVRV